MLGLAGSPTPYPGAWLLPPSLAVDYSLLPVQMLGGTSDGCSSWSLLSTWSARCIATSGSALVVAGVGGVNQPIETFSLCVDQKKH